MSHDRTRNGAGRSPAPIDPGRLDAVERKLWDSYAGRLPSRDGPAVQLWAFAYVCMRERGQVPGVVRERLRELGSDERVAAHLTSARRTRGAG